MPIGPSHGSRGGGGRSSGGFSFGGGRRRSSSSGSSLGGAIIGGLIYSAFADRRRRRFHNRYGYDPTPDEINSMPKRTAPTIFLILAIVVAFFSIVTMSMRSATIRSAESHESTIAIMENDYTDYYKPMIDAVDDIEIPVGSDYVNCGNGYYKTIATFSVVKYSYYSDNPTTPAAYQDFTEDNITYYFIVYKYYDVVARQYTTGTTYTQFSANQVQTLNGEIEIAYYSVAGKDSYSMNTSYDIDECEEYDYREDQAEDNRELAGIFLIAFIVEIVIIAGMIALYVLKLKKYKKLVKQDEDLLYQKRQAETQKAQAEAQEAQIDAQRKNRFCQYCGSQIDPESNTCSGCGARVSDDD